MHFILSILFISFMLNAECTQPPSDDQVFKQGFEKAKKSYKVAEGNGLTEENLAHFVTPLHSQKVHDFFNNNNFTKQQRDNIQLPLFETIITNLDLVEPLRETLEILRNK
ncbi:uncharacterized protein LOC126833698 [Adelges cooleyi]|uniref:uncharacterized protein LOC126833698 n=1 Tax=Adelges cooleyi TaxID=133065 RepID=UPI00217F8038|nr:uncharacterized protein LOC126833698 [Adelges cooleyi]